MFGNLFFTKQTVPLLFIDITSSSTSYCLSSHSTWALAYYQHFAKPLKFVSTGGEGADPVDLFWSSSNNFSNPIISLDTSLFENFSKKKRILSFDHL